MSSKTSTGDPTEYTDVDEIELAAAVDEGWDEFEAGQDLPTRMTVTAEVEWSGSRNKAHNGMRTVRLDDLDLSRVAAARATARAAEDRAARARESTTYRAQSWHAQLRALTGTPRGSELADRAGLNPTARTLSAWLSESRAPSAANRRAIAEAYEGLRTARVEAASAAAGQARHDVTEAITDAVRDRYGAEVRFFDVRNIEFDE
jgi:hypothetical protein